MKLSVLVFVLVLLAPPADTETQKGTGVSKTGVSGSDVSGSDVSGTPGRSHGRNASLSSPYASQNFQCCLSNPQRFTPDLFSRVLLIVLCIGNQLAVCTCFIAIIVWSNDIFGYLGHLTVMAYMYNGIITVHLDTILLRMLQAHSDWIPLQSIFTVLDNVMMAARFGGAWFSCFMMLEVFRLTKVPAKNRDFKTTCIGFCVAFLICLYSMGVMATHIYLASKGNPVFIDASLAAGCLVPRVVALGFSLFAATLARKMVASGSGSTFEGKLINVVIFMHLPELVSSILADLEVIFDRISNPLVTCFWPSYITVAYQLPKLIYCFDALKEFRAALLKDVFFCKGCSDDEEKVEKAMGKIEEEGKKKKKEKAGPETKVITCQVGKKSPDDRKEWIPVYSSLSPSIEYTRL